MEIKTVAGITFKIKYKTKIMVQMTLVVVWATKFVSYELALSPVVGVFVAVVPCVGAPGVDVPG